MVPTRELAIQIFDVLRLVGKHHSISAGLLIGGKKEFLEEQKRVVGMSLLVATPGRLLQHLEQTPGFEVGSLQVGTPRIFNGTILVGAPFNLLVAPQALSLFYCPFLFPLL